MYLLLWKLHVVLETPRRIVLKCCTTEANGKGADVTTSVTKKCQLSTAIKDTFDPKEFHGRL